MENEELKISLQQISDAEIKLGILMNTINQNNLNIENLSKIKLDLETTINSLNSKIESLKGDVSKQEVETTSIIESLKKQEVLAQGNFNISQKGFNDKIDILKKSYDTMVGDFGAKTLELDTKYKNNVASCESSLLSLKSQIDDYTNINNTLSKQKDDLTTGIQKLIFEVDDINNKISSANSELTTSSSKLISVNNDIKNNTIISQNLENDIRALNDVYKSLNIQKTGLMTEITESTNQRDELKTELEKDLIIHDTYVKEKLSLISLKDSLTQKENLLKYKFEKVGIPY